MTAPALEKLQVLVTGVDTVVARDVVRLLVEEGANVMAADRDGAKLARLDRDVGLYRSRLETATVDLDNLGKVREWEARLRNLGRAPQLIVCCCGAPACPSPSARRARPAGPARDVALGEHRVAGCPAAAAVLALQPTMFMHAEPLRRTVFDRAISVLRHPTLRGLIERAPGRTGLGSALPYARDQVREASQRSTPDGVAAARPRLRLVTQSDTARDRADAA
jgi:hypothetical protein